MTNQPDRPDANQLLLTGGRSPDSAEFGNAPSTVSGKLVAGPITYIAREFDARNPGQGALRYWPDGNPVYAVYLDLETPQGIRRLYVEKLRMTQAIREAMLSAGVQRLEHGGWLSVTLTGQELGQGSMPANTYSASWSPSGRPGGHEVLNASVPAQGMPVPAQGASVPAQGTAPDAAMIQRLFASAQSQSAPQVAAHFVPAQAAPAQAAQPAQSVAKQETTTVLTETIAAAMRNAGLSTDGYTIIPG